MYKVLLVDDEQIERMALAKKIDRYYGDKVSISQAIDGRDAIRVFQEEQSDIIIMDISMPEMNGVMAAREIRELSKDCSIIFLSAYNDFNYARNAIKVQALDYLLKPCDMQDMLAVMDAAIHHAENVEAARKRKLEKQKIEKQNIEKEPDQYGEGLHGIHLKSDQIEDSNGLDDVDNEQYSNTVKDERAVAERMKDYVKNNYSLEISMQDAAQTMGYSDAYFSKLFKQYFNQNFTAYLTEYRVNEAKKLLLGSNETIKDISKMVGYPDSNYFAKIFKRIEGVIPSRFREDHGVQNA